MTDKGGKTGNKRSDVSSLLLKLFYQMRLVFLVSVLALFLAGKTPDLQKLSGIAKDDFLDQRHADEILIPSLGVRAPVLKASSWKDEDVGPLLQQGVALLPTGWLSENNLVVTAHSSGPVAWGDKRFLFATIERLKSGDQVFLWNSGRLQEYRVKDMKVVSPKDIDKLPNDEKGTLTLVSCWPIGQNTQRILVIAEKQDINLPPT